MYTENSAKAKLVGKTSVWKMNNLGIEGSLVLDKCIITLHRRRYFSSLPPTDPCNQGAEFLCLSSLSHLFNSASLNLWPIDGFSAFQSALFCFALHFLSLLIDFTLFLSFWGSCISQLILPLMCVRFWDHSGEVLSALFSPFRFLFQLFAWVQRKHSYYCGLVSQINATQLSQ